MHRDSDDRYTFLVQTFLEFIGPEDIGKLGQNYRREGTLSEIFFNAMSDETHYIVQRQVFEPLRIHG